MTAPSTRRRIATGLLALFAAIGIAPAAQAQAQAFPSRPIKIVVPYPPGGTNDLVARLLAHKLQEGVGQPVLVENRPGASGNTGADAVTKSPADGYTLILVTTGHSIAPSLYAKLPYDITSDLVPVSELTTGPLLVLTNASGALKSMADLIAAAKARPGQINYASAGNGSSTHLSAELIAATAGVRFNHIPYKGSAPAMTDVMAGNADMVIDYMFSAMPHVQGGKLRAIAITSARRSPLLPEVPTLGESGLPPMEIAGWNGLMAPARTPRDVLARLNAEIRKAMDSADIKDKLMSQGFAVATGTPEQFGELLKSELALWAKVVKVSGARID